NGILDEFLTHKQLFWNNFFRTTKGNIFPVPPSSVIDKVTMIEDFENTGFQGKRSDKIKSSGKYALWLDKDQFIYTVAELEYPKLFSKSLTKKIKISFDSYFSKNSGQLHVFLQFFDRDHKEVLQVPFYVNQDNAEEKWDRREF